MGRILGALFACALVLTVATVPAGAAPAPAAAGSAEGVPAWLTKLQRAGTDETSAAIATHEGSTYVAATSVALDGSQEHGTRASDVAVTRLDATGAELWSRRAGTAYLDHAVDVVAGARGAFVLSTGTTSVDGSSGPSGFSVTRYDPDGDRVWTRWRADANGASGLAVLGDSYYVVGGSHVRRFDVATGDLLREHAGKVTEQVRATWSSVAVLGDDLVVLGSSPSGAGGDQLVLRRLDGRSLAVEWTKPFDVAEHDYPGDVVVADGRILLTGITAENFGGGGGDFGLVLADYAPDGARSWLRRFPYGAVPGYPALAVTPSGPAVFSSGYTLFGDDLGMVLETFSPAGARTGQSFVGEQYGPASATDIVWDVAAGLRVTGSDPGDAFDPTTPDQDAFVARVDDSALLVQARLAPRKLVLRTGRTRTSRLTLTNRGKALAVLAVRGCRGEQGVRLRVRSGGEDVTRAVRRGTWRSAPLARGRSVVLTIKAHAARQASPARTGCAFEISRPGTSAVPFDKYLRLRVVRRGRG